MNSVPRRAGREAFVDRFGSIYEHSPWIAERAWDLGADPSMEMSELHDMFTRVVQSAGKTRQLELLNAHPQLACSRAEQETMTGASRGEQSGAGLDRCTAEEYEEFQRLNRRYLARFGFPFILAVSGYGRQEILSVFRRRVANDPAEEFSEALRQVCRIGRFRLEALPHA